MGFDGSLWDVELVVDLGEICSSLVLCCHVKFESFVGIKGSLGFDVFKHSSLLLALPRHCVFFFGKKIWRPFLLLLAMMLD